MKREQRSLRLFPRAAILAAAALALVAALGCTPAKTEYVVPEFDAAMEQFAFAENQRQRTTASTKPERRLEQLEQLVLLYRKVVERFPEDRVHTPQAKVRIAQLLMRSRTDEGLRQSVEILEECVKLYPDDDYIMAFSLLQLGIAYDALQQFEMAQMRYREVFDRFGADGDPRLKELANKARSSYNRVRTRSGSSF